MRNEIQLRSELGSLLNRLSIDNECNTADWLLSDMLVDILLGYKKTLEERQRLKGEE